MHRMAKLAGLTLATIYSFGCAGNIGIVSPVLLTAKLDDGQVVTEVYYETRGVQWTNGYAVVGGDEEGPSALEGGNLSESGGAVIVDTIAGVGRILGALLSPFGAASAALSVTD